jgi:hypothetical protein
VKRVAVLLAVGAAIAGIAKTATTATPAPRQLQSVADTHDVLPVVVDQGANAGVGFYWRFDGEPRSLAHSLAVFQEPRRPEDLLRPDEQYAFEPSPGFTPEPSRARLLIAVGSIRVTAYPTKQGDVCYSLGPLGAGSCVAGLIDGAMPQVTGGQVWGLMDNGATAVAVRVPASGWLHAALGRNAFYLRLPPHVLAPSEIVVRERSGIRHFYTIERCRPPSC